MYINVLIFLLGFDLMFLEWEVIKIIGVDFELYVWMDLS